MILKKEFRLLIVGLCSVFIVTSVNAQKKAAWQMRANTIVTRWASEVDIDHPLHEYPRPQMVRASYWQNLNGPWEYAVTKDTTSNIPEKFEGQILVPYPIEAALSGVGRSLLPDQRLWYRKSFKRPPFKKSERLILHFGAVDWEATIFVNNVRIGKHSGGYQSFSFDVTSFLREGENVIHVKVYDPTDRGIGPHGKQVLNPESIYYTPSSGIWQTVWLERIPAKGISDLKISTDIDKSFAEITVSAVASANVRIDVTDGHTIIASANGSTNTPIRIFMNDIKLWSPESPFLYHFDVTLLSGRKELDRISSYYAMRKVSVAPDSAGIYRLFLNNKPYFNLGVLDQGFWPDGLYTAPTDSALMDDIVSIKKMGFNTIRKHIKVEPARWYYYTDSIGMIVWQDFVNPNQGLPDGAKQAFEKEVKETISQLDHFPSISVWVIFNERWGAYDQRRITEWIKRSDPSRIVNGHSGELLYVDNQLRAPSDDPYVASDLSDVHSYPLPRDPLFLPRKAKVIGEFGGISVPLIGHVWDDLKAGWGYNGLVNLSKLKDDYAALSDSIKVLKDKGLAAAIYTQPFDVESEQNGLVTYDRKVIKMPLNFLRNCNLKLLDGIWYNKLPMQIGYSQATPDQEMSYPRLLDKYNSGLRDSGTLRILTVLAVNDDPEKVAAYANEYMSVIKNPLDYQNLLFIERFAASTKDSMFQTAYRSIGELKNKLGIDKADGIIIRCIERDFIIPAIRNEGGLNWKSLQQEMSKSYGSYGEEAVLQACVFYAVNSQKFTELHNVVDRWYNDYGCRRAWITDEILNNIAWAIFDNISDPNVLKAALAMSRKSVGNDNKPHKIDTYANLLYKCGRKADALHWEQKAVEFSNNEEIYVQTLDKMRKNIKTWN